MPLGRLRATEIAAKVSIGIALLFVAGYFLLGHVIPFFGNPMLILIVGLMVLMGQQELALVRHQDRMRRAREAEAEVVSAEPLMYDVTGEPIRPGFSGFLWDGRIRAWVLWRDGHPVATYGAGPE
jgi:hypothetical protein